MPLYFQLHKKVQNKLNQYQLSMMSTKAAINQTTCIIDSLLCRQRQAWTRARRVNRSGGALTAPGGRGDARRRIVFCWYRSRAIGEHRATSNADAIPNLLTSLKYHGTAPEVRPIRSRGTEKFNFDTKNNCVNSFYPFVLRKSICSLRRNFVIE